MNLRTFFVFIVIAFFAPAVSSAQSLEWLAEHPGSSASPQAGLTTPAQTVSAPSAPATNDGIEARVRAYFSDVPVMASIAKCESGFRQFDSDGQPLDGGSGAMIGIFQINANVHAKYAKSIGMDIYTVDGNLAYARKLYQEEGSDPWLSSFACWHVDANTGPQNPSDTTSALTQDLFLGVIDSQVKALQIMLNTGGFKLADAGPGSPGQETEKFGLLTRTAVRSFQCMRMQLCGGDEHSNEYGMVGTKTRAALLAIGQSPNTQVAAAASATDSAAEIARLTNLISQLSAQLADIKQKLAKS